MKAASGIATLMVVGHLMAASAGAASPATDAATSVAAQWVPRTAHFMYSAVAPSSETTYFSCDRLQGRIETFLRQLGARGATVKPFGCFTNGGAEKFPGVDATFSVLEPVAAGAPSKSEKVEAHWQKVVLEAEGSCALLEQVKSRILPLFATRNPASGCSTGLKVEVLQPVKSAAPESS